MSYTHYHSPLCNIKCNNNYQNGAMSCMRVSTCSWHKFVLSLAPHSFLHTVYLSVLWNVFLFILKLESRLVLDEIIKPCMYFFMASNKQYNKKIKKKRCALVFRKSSVNRIFISLCPCSFPNLYGLFEQDSLHKLAVFVLGSLLSPWLLRLKLK